MSLRRPIHTAADPVVIDTVKSLVLEGAKFLTRTRTGSLTLLLKKGETLDQRGQYLYIDSSDTYRREVASHRIKELSGAYSVRWVNELYFINHKNPKAVSLKFYIRSIHPVYWNS